MTVTLQTWHEQNSIGIMFTAEIFRGEIKHVQRVEWIYKFRAVVGRLGTYVHEVNLHVAASAKRWPPV